MFQIVLFTDNLWIRIKLFAHQFPFKIIASESFHNIFCVNQSRIGFIINPIDFFIAHISVDCTGISIVFSFERQNDFFVESNIAQCRVLPVFKQTSITGTVFPVISLFSERKQTAFDFGYIFRSHIIEDQLTITAAVMNTRLFPNGSVQIPIYCRFQEFHWQLRSSQQ